MDPMKMMGGMRLITVAALGFPLLAQVSVYDQETNGVRSSAVFLGNAEHVAMQPRAVQFVAGMSEATLVKGAPYSGEGVTEFVQTLSDGTRITRKSFSKMARDSEGRTRNENSGTAAGPIGFEVEPLVVINDPVAKELIYLHEHDRRADRVPMMRFNGEDGARNIELQMARVSTQSARAGVPVAQADRDVVFQRAVPAPPPPPPPPGVVAVAGTASSPANFAYTTIAVLPGGKEAQRESLGKQNIAGVSCDTTRVTNTIPAGQIGNDREIRVFTETCVSPELKITLLSRTVDPMNGETTFRIASLNRAEPSKSLFQIPAGYTVEDPATVDIRGAVPATPAMPAAPGVRTKIIRKQ